MQLGIIGVGRMGSDMTRRLLRRGHPCVVYDHAPAAVDALVREGAVGAASLEDVVARLTPPRVIWFMLPAAAVESAVTAVSARLAPGDTLIDGGNSHYRDAIRRARGLASQGIHYVDVGVSGGVWGLERGYCLMIGGANDPVQRLTPVFAALAPPPSAPPASGRAPAESTAEQGYLHCGPSGAGHFVKMIHNGIEYGLMAAYAEGFNILRHANVGDSEPPADAETTPLRRPEDYQYEFKLAEIAELWRHGSVVGSWLLDLLAGVLREDAALTAYSAEVADSGEGRWTIQAAIDEATPAPVLSSALFARFSSRGEDDFANRLLSALRHQFGGHGAPS